MVIYSAMVAAGWVKARMLNKKCMRVQDITMVRYMILMLQRSAFGSHHKEDDWATAQRKEFPLFCRLPADRNCYSKAREGDDNCYIEHLH